MIDDRLRTLGLIAIAGAALAVVQSPLAVEHAHVKETSDVYFLPPPDDVVKLSLGYRSAFVDVLWAHVLVSQGLHTTEHRRFENLSRLMDTINTLEPTFREPYLLADALITFQAAETPIEEVRRARAIMERGARELPLDAEVWLALGEFTAYVAPASYLTDAAEKKQWRLDGAAYLARAAELAGDDARIGWRAIAGANLLNRQGDRAASIRFLERALAVTENDELRAHIQASLVRLLGESEGEKYAQRSARFLDLWRNDAPFVSKGAMLLLGPPRRAAYCAGLARLHEPECAPTWRAWAELEEQER